MEHSRSVWNAQPVAFVGTASSQEEADAIPVVERNDITFALLDYTYGVNGFDRSDLPAYAVSFIDEERIRADVARAQEAADVVLVAMHWGTENQTEPGLRPACLRPAAFRFGRGCGAGVAPARHRAARLGGGRVRQPNARGLLAGPTS